jgi:hypothetical protein
MFRESECKKTGPEPRSRSRSRPRSNEMAATRIDQLPEDVIRNIGLLLSFNDRRVCERSHRCFSRVHGSLQFAKWRFGDGSAVSAGLLRQKLAALVKRQPLTTHLDVTFDGASLDPSEADAVRRELEAGARRVSMRLFVYGCAEMLRVALETRIPTFVRAHGRDVAAAARPAAAAAAARRGWWWCWIAPAGAGAGAGARGRRPPASASST